MDTETYEELEEVFDKVDKVIKDYIGKRCLEFNFNCASCKLHNIYEKFKIELANEIGGNQEIVKTIEKDTSSTKNELKEESIDEQCRRELHKEYDNK